MSAHLLSMMPTDPSWVPVEDAAVRARQILTELPPDAEKVAAECYDKITLALAGSAPPAKTRKARAGR